MSKAGDTQQFSDGEETEWGQTLNECFYQLSEVCVCVWLNKWGWFFELLYYFSSPLLFFTLYFSGEQWSYMMLHSLLRHRHKEKLHACIYCMCIQTLQWELRLLSDAERSLSCCLLLTASQNDLRPPGAPDCEAANGQLQQLLVFLPGGDIFIELQIKLVLFFMFFFKPCVLAGVCGTFVVQILKVNS